jgi:PEP-CTERM motif
MPKSAILTMTVLICFASDLHGGSIPYTSVFFEARSNFISGLCDCPVYEGAGSVNASYSTTGLGGSGTFSGSGSATSVFGTLSAYGTAEISGFPAGSNVGLAHIDSSTGVSTPLWVNAPVFATASFTDRVTLSGPAATYNLALDVLLSGTTATTGDGIGAVARIMALASAPGAFYHLASENYTTSGEYQLLVHNIPSNVPFDLTFYLQAFSNITDQVWLTDSNSSDFHSGDFSAAHIVGVIDNRTGPYSASVTLDFSHTARFGNYEVTLPDGSAATGVSLVSANGFSYDSVPEPSTVGMVAVGIGAVLAILRRRSSPRLTTSSARN